MKTPQLDPPTPDDVIRLIEAATDDDPDFGCFLLVAATTGARRGEVRALRWSGLDLSGKAVTISRSVVETEHSEMVEKDTKTHASRRIALGVGTVDVLKSHRERCTARAAACNVVLPVTAHVFSRDPDGTRP